MGIIVETDIGLDNAERGLSSYAPSALVPSGRVVRLNNRLRGLVAGESGWCSLSGPVNGCGRKLR